MNVTVEVKDVTDELFVKEHLASGSYYDKDFEACTTIPSRSLLIEYRGNSYMVDTRDLTEAILRTLTEEKA